MAEIRERRTLLLKKPVVINIGLDLFYQALEDQTAEVINVNWKPPSNETDPEIQNILDQLL
jgi:hypothetical protein